MISQAASAACRAAIEPVVAGKAAGAVYYVLRAGKPLVDASVGKARALGSPDGDLDYGPDTIVHIASMSKFICAVAVLRFVEEWNEIQSQLHFRGIGPQVHPSAVAQWEYRGPPRPFDKGLIRNVELSGQMLALTTPVYDLMEPYLDDDIVGKANALNGHYPGTGVDAITLQGLLTHMSGMRDVLFDLIPHLQLVEASIINENDPSGVAFFDLKKFTTIVFSRDCEATTGSYSNDGFSVLGAFIEFLSGVQFEDWCREKIFPGKAFDDIARRPVDMARAARYYALDDAGNLTGGAFHPDYRYFGACGGWYTSARVFCEWVQAVMHRRHFGRLSPVQPVSSHHLHLDHGLEGARQIAEGTLASPFGRPIVRDPDFFFDFWAGFDRAAFDLGYLAGRPKNGGTGVPGTSTNGAFVYLRGYGDYSIVAFAEANGPLDGAAMLAAGLPPLRPWLYNPGPARDDGTPEVMTVFDEPGLVQVAYWDESGVARNVTRGVAFATASVTIDGITAVRTDLAGTTPYTPGRSLNLQAFICLEGLLQSIEGGTYGFRLSSDDGAMLWIDGKLVIDNDGTHFLRSRTGTAYIPADTRLDLTIYWYNVASVGALYLEWQRPGHPDFEAVPPERLHQGNVRIRPIPPPYKPIPI
jgi:CubicO group peptidase (beta-lactamase class C family)